MTTLNASLGTDRLGAVSDMLKCLSHPIRLSVVDLLSQHEELCVSELQRRIEIEQAVLSQHLALMYDKNILNKKRSGKQIFYFLKQPKFVEIVKLILECSECDTL
jgi:DNA-binding transcriptional ArsR family regulator